MPAGTPSGGWNSSTQLRRDVQPSSGAEPAHDTAWAGPTAVSRAANQGRIRVVSMDSGRPVPGASVEFCFWPAGSEQEVIEVRQVNAEGIIDCDYGPGELRVVAWKANLTARPKFIDVQPGSPIDQSLHLQPAHTLQGRVVDLESGLPVQGASVCFRTFSESDEVLTDADGWFLHPRFPSSGMAEQIHINAEGYGSSVRYLSVDDRGRWEMPASQATAQAVSGDANTWIELSLVPELRLQGRLVDAKGQPIVHAQVICEGFFRAMPDVAARDASSTRSGANGEFCVSGLRSDISHGLVVRAQGFGELTLELAQTSVDLLELGPLTLKRECLVAGVVVDANGMPAEDLLVELIRVEAQSERSSRAKPERQGIDVAVRISGHVREESTDAHGVFVFERSAATDYRLFVSRDEQVLLSLELNREQVLSAQALNLSLPNRCSTLVGRVLNAPPGTRVELHRAGLLATVGLDAGGYFRIAGLDLEGPYVVLARTVYARPGGPEQLWEAQDQVWAHEQPVLQMKPESALGQGVLAKIALK